MTPNEAYLKLIHVYFPKSVVMLIKHLEDHPMTVPEIATYLRLSEDQSYKIVSNLKQRKIICAVEYRLTGTCHRKVYGLGSKDAPREKRERKEISRDYRKRQKYAESTLRQAQSFGGMFGG